MAPKQRESQGLLRHWGTRDPPGSSLNVPGSKYGGEGRNITTEQLMACETEELIDWWMDIRDALSMLGK